MSIQATTETAGGRAKTEVAFMAGVEEQEGDKFEQRLARRHDFQAAGKVYEWLGKQAPKTAAGLIREGRYIPKAMMPNGITDMMYWLDCAKDEVLGRNTVRHPEDYAAMKLESKRKEASLKGVREQVIEGLKGAADVLQTAGQASRYMWHLVREHATEASLTNLNIDPRVFGHKAARSITVARHHLRNGNQYIAQEHMRRAHWEAEVTGCGGGASKNETDEELSEGGNQENLESIAGSDRFGPRAFRCSNGHLNIRPKNEKIPACQHQGCTAKVKC